MLPFFMTNMTVQVLCGRGSLHGSIPGSFGRKSQVMRGGCSSRGFVVHETWRLLANDERIVSLFLTECINETRLDII